MTDPYTDAQKRMDREFDEFRKTVPMLSEKEAYAIFQSRLPINNMS